MQREDAVFVGLGANLGDARSRVLAALRDCAALPDTLLRACSSLYRSAPIESSGDDYVNAVIRLETALTPLALLDALQAIEQRHGRERPYPNAPRTLDLDLLMYGQQRMQTPRLSLPHPRCHQRAFVLLPLLELAPEVVIPGLGPARKWLEGVAEQSIERISS